MPFINHETKVPVVHAFRRDRLRLGIVHLAEPVELSHIVLPIVRQLPRRIVQLRRPVQLVILPQPLHIRPILIHILPFPVLLPVQLLPFVSCPFPVVLDDKSFGIYFEFVRDRG